MPKGSEFCLSCGRSTPESPSPPPPDNRNELGKERTELVIFTFVALLIAALAQIDRFIYKPRNPNDLLLPDTASEPTQPKGGLEYQFDAKWIRLEDGGFKIVGTVKNTSGRQYGYAQIVFSLYDKSGAPVGNAWANVNNLEAGGTWKFEALVVEDRAETFKFSDITGW
jgi:hypothetical protein